MKREGRQHGTVRATAAAAPCKPTAQSRFTGKRKKARCGQCHSHPVSKARDKAKGSYKLRSADVLLNHRLVTWRVVDGSAHRHMYPPGVSATGALDALLAESGWSQGDDDDREEDLSCSSQEYYDCEDQIAEAGGIHGVEAEGGENEGGEEEEDDDDEEEDVMGFCEVGFGEEDDDDEEEEEDVMGFCEVGFVMGFVEEGGWCVVDEM